MPANIITVFLKLNGVDYDEIGFSQEEWQSVINAVSDKGVINATPAAPPPTPPPKKTRKQRAPETNLSRMLSYKGGIIELKEFEEIAEICDFTLPEALEWAKGHYRISGPHDDGTVTVFSKRECIEYWRDQDGVKTQAEITDLSGWSAAVVQGVLKTLPKRS